MPFEIESIVDTESALMLAVRDQLREKVPLDHDECEIEFADMAPASAGQLYVAVKCVSHTPGDSYEGTHGDTDDEIIDIDTVIALRVSHVGRDRLREKYMCTSNLFATRATINALAERIRKVLVPPRSRYWELMERADLLLHEVSTGQKWEQRLRWKGHAPNVRVTDPGFWGETPGKSPVGLLRAVHFGGAQRKRINI